MDLTSGRSHFMSPNVGTPTVEDDLIGLMRRAAQDFIAILRRQPACQQLPTPLVPAHPGPLSWSNTLFGATAFRRAHVELFEVPGLFAVCHVCIIPHTCDEAPIFGFDMIAGRAQATGIFLDFSPVTARTPTPALCNVVSRDARAGFRHHRQRPEWGSIFSDDFFAIRPVNWNETCSAVALANSALDYFLLCVQENSSARGGMKASDPFVLQGQSAYAQAQRQNPHTLRMLARLVGAEPARNFIDEILFPLPEC
jgi:hypothetical protein